MREIGNPTVTIAVLPFEDEAKDPDQGYFSRGFIEELAIELSRFSTLEIIHPQTSFLSPISELKVNYLLRGSVRRMDDTVRVTALLVDAGSGRQIWAGRFDPPAERLLAVQREIAGQAASTLAVKIESARLQIARRTPLLSLEVYDCWLRGLDCLHRGTIEDDAHARTFFDRALALDPSYARAYAGLSLSHFNEWSCQAWELWDEKERLAYENARRAADLDDQDALIQLVLGRIQLYRRNFDEATRHVDRAIDLNPNDADCLAQAAVCRAYLGDLESSLALGTKAIRLNPHHPDWYVPGAALPLFLLERYSEVLPLILPTPDATVEMPAFLAATYAMTGDSLRARQWMEKFLTTFEEKITFGRQPEPGEHLRWIQHVNPFRRREDAAIVERALRLAGLPTDPDEGRAARTVVSAGAERVQALFRKEGDVRTIAFEGLALQLTDIKGFHDLAELIAQPHRPIHCLDLAGRSAEIRGDDPVLDDRARRELTARARSLQEDIETGTRLNDQGRTEQARAELEQIAETLSQAFGLAGKPRRLGSSVEKARTAVTWRIRNAIRKTAAAHPGLGRHFENSVRTGTYCTYAPEKQVNWVL